MRLTGKEIECLLQEIIDEKPEYQKPLILDRLQQHKESNPDLLIRMIEISWDEIFGFDSDLEKIAAGTFNHLAFFNVKDRLFKLIEDGNDIKLLIQRLGNRYKIFDYPELVSDSFPDLEKYAQNYLPWHIKFGYIIVLQKLFEVYLENKKKPPLDLRKLAKKINKEGAALHLYLEGIPDEYRPQDYMFHLTDGKNGEKLEGKYSAYWQKLDEMYGYKDKYGKRMQDAFFDIQNFVYNETTKELVNYIKAADGLPLTPKGRKKLDEMRAIINKKSRV